MCNFKSDFHYPRLSNDWVLAEPIAYAMHNFCQGTQCKAGLLASRSQLVLTLPTLGLNKVTLVRELERLPLDHLGSQIKF